MSSDAKYLLGWIWEKLKKEKKASCYKWQVWKKMLNWMRSEDNKHKLGLLQAKHKYMTPVLSSPSLNVAVPNHWSMIPFLLVQIVPYSPSQHKTRNSNVKFLLVLKTLNPDHKWLPKQSLVYSKWVWGWEGGEEIFHRQMKAKKEQIIPRTSMNLWWLIDFSIQAICNKYVITD